MFATLTAATLLSMTLVTTPAHESRKDIVETAVAAGSFNTLATALTEAGLVEALQGDGPFTVFAPNDEAFAALPEGTLATLLKPENKDQLVSILTYHVVAGDVTSKQVVKLDNAGTLNGQRVNITVDDKGVRINDALVTTVDIECSNGVIHVIDSVLLPSQDDLVGTAVKAGSFETLVAAVKAAGLAETLMGEGPFTVLAPNDEAFAKLPDGTVESLLRPENLEKLRSILSYHVIPGRVYSDDALRDLEFTTVQSAPVRFAVMDDVVTVEGAKVVAVDLDTTNGVIHVIDSVIMPPAKTRQTGKAVQQVIDTAVAHGAPLFNAGEHLACAAIYTVATQNLLLLPKPELSQPAMHRLANALMESRRAHDSAAQAWILREALDDVRQMAVAPVMAMPARSMTVQAPVNAMTVSASPRLRVEAASTCSAASTPSACSSNTTW